MNDTREAIAATAQAIEAFKLVEERRLELAKAKFRLWQRLRHPLVIDIQYKAGIERVMTLSRARWSHARNSGFLPQIEPRERLCTR